jgi:thermostable 8-oxoguanine DNA glycosylase
MNNKASQLYFDEKARAVLRLLITVFGRHVRLERLGCYQEMNHEAVWRVLVGQVCVMGSARPMERLNRSPRSMEFERVTSLQLIQQESNPQSYLAKILRDFHATRFPSKAAKTLAQLLKTESVFCNANVVLLKGLSQQQDPTEIRAQLLKRSGVFRLKSASDFMISVGLSHDVIALDTRVVGVLRRWCGFKHSVGRIQSNGSLYASVEQELREFCETENVRLAFLDRLLFKFSAMSAMEWVMEYVPGLGLAPR